MSEQQPPWGPHDRSPQTGVDRGVSANAASAEDDPMSFGDALRAGFLSSGLSPTALWAGYFSMGGNLSQDEVLAALFNGLVLSPHDHNMVAQALNEHFIEVGRNHLVPYFDQLIEDSD